MNSDSSNHRAGKPGHLWTPRNERRGKISDMNAFLRMKKHVINVLGSYGITCQVSKALIEDDSIVLHGHNILQAMDHTILHALDNNGIEYTKGGDIYFGVKKPGDFSFVLISIDQIACPQTKHRKLQ